MKSTVAPTLALVLVGCGSSPEGPSDASVSDATMDVRDDGDARPDVRADAACGIVEGCGYPCPGDFVPTPLPTIVPRNDCTPSEIKTVFDACFGTTATAPACTSAFAAVPACAGCLVGPLSSGPAAANDNGYVRLNVAACLALTSNDPACGQRWQDVYDCTELYCSGLCIPDGDPNQRAKCIAQARAGYCASWVATECAPADGGPTAVCGVSSFEGSFTSFATLLCAGGKGVADAGSD